MKLCATSVSALLVPGLLWLWLFWHVHYTWSLDEQYRYGWAVPFLAAFLLYMRWQDKPAADAAPERAVFTLLPAVLLALLLPIRLVQEANPDWRLLGWVLGLIVVAYSLLTVRRLGGGAWVRHLAFPICFALVAVPWLVRIEQFVVQHLTRVVAACAVEIASWIGLGAYQLGNVIQLRNGFVGVDEACSGVRTLQTSIMVSLFLGELLRLTTARRVGLLAISAAWVLVCNVGRASTLVAIAGMQGFDALHRAHNTVGTIVMLVGLAGIFAASWMLRNPKQRDAPAAPGYHWPAANPMRAVAGVAWLAVIFCATELWYRAHERHLPAEPAWAVEWPKQSENFESVPIPDSTRSILQYNFANSAAWRGADGAQWWGFFARWNAARTARQLVRSHSPDICLPAIGRTFEGELPPVILNSATTPLPFRVYQFTQQEKPLFVFVCIQEARRADADFHEADWSTRGRLRAAWRGERNPGQRLLELALSGVKDAAEANAAAAKTVAAIVQPATD